MAHAGLRHWMLHNDQLAKEYDETLKLSPGFDPVRDVDPALSFHAPLLTGTYSIPGAIKGIVGRNSEAIGRAPRGTFLLKAPDFEQRHEYDEAGNALGAQMEPSATNSSGVDNLDRVDPADWILSGGPATIERIVDYDLIAKAGLTKLCPNGELLRITAQSDCRYWLSPSSPGSTDDLALSVYARGRFFLHSGYASSGQFVHENIERAEYVDTQGNALRVFSISVNAGDVCEFIGWQIAVEKLVTSLIHTPFGPASRAVDQLSWPLAGAPYGEQLLANDRQQSGLLTSGTLPWFSTFNRDGWNIEHGILEGLDIANWDTARQDCNLETGKLYQFDFEILETNDAQLSVYIGTHLENFTGVPPGIYSVIAEADADYVQFGNTNWVGKVRALNVREASPILNQTEGMGAFILRANQNDSEWANGQIQRLINSGDNQIVRLDKNATTGNVTYQLHDGVNTAAVAVANGMVADQIDVVIFRWSSSPFEMQIAFKRVGIWTDSALAPYDGALQLNGELNAIVSPSFVWHLSQLMFWTADRGLDYLKELFEGIAE